MEDLLSRRGEWWDRSHKKSKLLFKLIWERRRDSDSCTIHWKIALELSVGFLPAACQRFAWQTQKHTGPDQMDAFSFFAVDLVIVLLEVETLCMVAVLLLPPPAAG